ncbi:efflux RND transporter periplasmic adaptor subunit [Stieleria varia]|nr:efflux RND transporter periplasmic adaptor subunit [Stieleria varia]
MTADSIWAQSPAMVERLELAGQSWDQSAESIESFCLDALRSLTQVVLADAGRILQTVPGATTTEVNRTLASLSPQDHVSVVPADNEIRIERPLFAAQRLVLELSPSGHLDPETRQAARHACEAVCGVVVDMLNRIQMASSEVQLSQQSAALQLIDQLGGEPDALIRLARICQWLQSQSGDDRVSVLESSGDRFRMLTASVQPSPDRHARVVAAIESLVRHLHRRSSAGLAMRLRTSDANDEIERHYFAVTGSISTGLIPIHAKPSSAQGVGALIGVVVCERFSEPESDSPQIVSQTLPQSTMALMESLVKDALMMRSLGVVNRLYLNASKRRRWLMGAAVASVLAFLLWPVMLVVEANGYMEAVKHQTIYAPADAAVSEVLVVDGQSVALGETLVRLHSDEIDQHRTALQGELAAVTAKLQVATSRRLDSADRRERDVDLAASDEKVLLVEQAALKEQLAVLQRRQDSLTLQSPIAGIVQHWQLEQSLDSRPVVHGQPLFKIADVESGWTVQMEISDAEIGFVQSDDQMKRPCTFRVRANPDIQFHGTVDRIASTTQLDDQGLSVVSAESVIVIDDQNLLGTNISSGTTVVASIDCGRRTRVFVLFRHLIGWGRIHGWW